MRVRKDGSFHFTTSTVMSRTHLIRNLNRMLKNGRIDAWKVYDGSTSTEEWEFDNEKGWF